MSGGIVFHLISPRDDHIIRPTYPIINPFAVILSLVWNGLKLIDEQTTRFQVRHHSLEHCVNVLIGSEKAEPP